MTRRWPTLIRSNKKSERRNQRLKEWKVVGDGVVVLIDEPASSG
jgi:hypothetical protein